MGENWKPETGTPNLKGKIALVTGANSGIGLHTVKNLALKGAKVYYSARSESKANAAKKEILALHPEIPESLLVWLKLELSDLGSVVEATRWLSERESKLDILVNNAGMATKDLETTDAGWEIGIAVCHIGHFVLTNGLLPLLKNAASAKNSDVRVVTVSSSANYLFLPSDYKIDLSNPAFLYGQLPYEPWQYRYIQKRMFKVNVLHYAMSKLANVLFAQELQRRFDKLKLPIISISAHPGAVKSDNAVGIFSPLLQPVIRRAMLDLDEGSYTTLFAATAPEVWRKPEVYKGKYLEPFGQLKDPHPFAKDNSKAAALWNTTTQEVERYFVQRGFEPLLEW
ncbi:hypothetical protein NM208_g10462 [Fusarium decemcellulare]|uniref:Uncharacterized protein n=1 Tax=Fusarium decemcellulare TaxID=57161 RepID=A0ACC1RXT5_9HYPO|nr:hypothetical protein NM208_g10462 [Fusarium decemcellulare]